MVGVISHAIRFVMQEPEMAHTKSETPVQKLGLKKQMLSQPEGPGAPELKKCGQIKRER